MIINRRRTGPTDVVYTIALNDTEYAAIAAAISHATEMLAGNGQVSASPYHPLLTSIDQQWHNPTWKN